MSTDTIIALASIFLVGVVAIGGQLIAFLDRRAERKKQLIELEAKERQAEKDWERRREDEFARTLEDAYGEVLGNITILQETGISINDYVTAFVTTNKHLAFIAAHHWDKQSKDFLDFMRDYESFYDAESMKKNIEFIRRYVIEFSKNDPRLRRLAEKPPNK